MPQFLFDTDHLTLYERNHPLIVGRLMMHPKGDIAISVVTIEESLRGRLAALARARDARARLILYPQLLAALTFLLNCLSFPGVRQASMRSNNCIACGFG